MGVRQNDKKGHTYYETGTAGSGLRFRESVFEIGCRTELKIQGEKKESRETGQPD